MKKPGKESERVEFLCNKYSSDSVDVAKLICDDHPSENIAFRIFDTDMKASDLIDCIPLAFNKLRDNG